MITTHSRGVVLPEERHLPDGETTCEILDERIAVTEDRLQATEVVESGRVVGHGLSSHAGEERVDVVDDGLLDVGQYVVDVDQKLVGVRVEELSRQVGLQDVPAQVGVQQTLQPLGVVVDQTQQAVVAAAVHG